MKKAKNNNLLQQFESNKIEKLENIKKVVGGANNTETSSADSGTRNPPPEILVP